MGKKKDKGKSGKNGKKDKKDKKGQKREKKKIDEFQLRRELREQKRKGLLFDFDDENEMQTEQQLPRKSSKMLLAGIEGGGTHSVIAVLDESGNILTQFNGPDSNHWLLGLEETAARITAMVQRGKELANIPATIPIDCLGLSLSGCEEEQTNRALREILIEKYPNTAKDYIITSDTVGSLRTGLEGGGIVLISGTGSNALLINPDGKTHGCGGWGYMLGDEGSAYWIAQRACKYVFDDLDGLVASPRPISYVWPAIRSYFSVTDQPAMLPHFYTNFNKSTIANFAKELATGCEKEDPLCLYLFEEAGKLLAKHVIALDKKADNDVKMKHGGLKVICVGSVWKSWKFMEQGFVNEISKSAIEELSLLQLQVSAALGACYLAAEKMECYFKKPYDTNSKVLFHYNRKNKQQEKA